MGNYTQYPTSSSGGAKTYANFAALPSSATDGTLAVTLDTDTLYVYDATLAMWLSIGGSAVPLSIGALDSAGPSVKAATIGSNTLYMQSAGPVYPGVVSSASQIFAGVKTFAAGIVSSVTGHASLDVATSSLGTTTETSSAVLELTSWTGATVGSPSIRVIQGTGSVSGFISSTDWLRFDTKQNTLPKSTGSVDGYLSKEDWVTFNGKQATLSQATGSVNGFLSSSDWVLFNGKADNGAYVAGTSSANVVAFWNSTNTIAGNAVGSTTLFWDNTNGRLGVGVPNPVVKFQVGGVGTGTDGMLIGGNKGFGYALNTDGTNYGFMYPTTDAIKFGFNSSLAVPTSPILSISSAGIVCVGSLSSAYTLNVAGGINSNSSVSATSHVVGSLTLNQTTDGARYAINLPASQGSSTASYLKNDGAGGLTWSYTPPDVQTLSSASGTYTTPVGAKYLKIKMVGGGGGGGGGGSDAGAAGTAGSSSTFGTTLLSAGGGSYGSRGGKGGAGGASSLGTGPLGVALSGGLGATGTGTSGVLNTGLFVGGSGASSAFGGSGCGGTYSGAGTAGTAGVGNTGGGGGGGGTDQVNNGLTGSGGGAGGYIEAVIIAPLGTYSYYVGDGGAAQAAGTSGGAGGKGGSGLIIVEAYYF